jgi:signal transduction histidine kinase
LLIFKGRAAIGFAGTMMREDIPGNRPLEGLEEIERLQQENASLAQQLRNEFLERKKTEEALLRAKKLEAVGILAGGIGHDFNNMLTVITGNISLAKIFLSPEDKAFGLLNKAEDVAMRASDLTEQLVSLSRDAGSGRKLAVISDLIKKASLFSLSGSNVRCEINIVADLLPIECDEGRIRQVIHNMVLNARDAMPKGGVVTVTASNEVVVAGQGL